MEVDNGHKAPVTSILEDRLSKICFFSMKTEVTQALGIIYHMNEIS